MTATSAPRLLAGALLLLATLSGGVAHGQLPPVPADTGLLRSARIDSLPPAQRSAWRAYLAASRRRYAADRDSMLRELRALGRDSIVSAVEGPNKVLVPRMTDAWF